MEDIANDTAPPSFTIGAADQRATDEHVVVSTISLGGLLGFAPSPDEWQRRSLCTQTDPEAFFPEKGCSTRDAKRICQRCPVIDQCRDYALDNDERFGIWGGLSERERRRLKKGVVAYDTDYDLDEDAVGADDGDGDHGQVRRAG